MMPAPGERIEGLFIEKELGRGAFGVVYLARDELLGRPVALKVLSTENIGLSETGREQALSEARLVANLQSPNVVALYRLHETPYAGFWQEMEYVEGGSLEGRLSGGRSLPLVEAVQVFRGLCGALEAAHAARVVHGDVKPANLLFTADGTPKLTDFGVARLLEGEKRDEDLRGEIVGSPLYMAPEVISGLSTGMASDIWSAGVLFYQMLCGRLPFAARSFPELLWKVTSADPDPLPAEIPEGVQALVARCLAKLPADRPSSARELLEALDVLAATDVRLGTLAPAPARPTNFSPPLTSFVGRECDIHVIEQLLRESPVVTITGPGGIGKTRLAQELCIRLLDRFEGGCFFVDLSEVRDAVGIAHAVADALGLPPPGAANPVEYVADCLSFRFPTLMVLDNFEQVVSQAHATLVPWREKAPEVCFLVTSRSLLMVPDERRHELGPLPVPAEGVPGDPAEFAGVRLFAERAREADREFRLDAATAADVARIVTELNGVPLAIELAAARVRVMRPAQIATNLARKFQLLTSSRLDLTVRQRSLSGAIEWSFELLLPWEKDAYLQSCAFRDGFFAESVGDVIDLSVFPDAPGPFDVARSLRDKSLLTAHDTGLGVRLSMYRAIREYGERKWLQTAGEERRTALAHRHSTHFLSLAEAWNEKVPGPRDQEAFDRISLELGNLLAVMDFACSARDGELATRTALAVAETMAVRRPPRQLTELLVRARSAAGPGPSRGRARLLAFQALACRQSGEWDLALAAAEDAIREANSAGGDRELAWALYERGEMLRNRGRLEEALSSFAESRTAAALCGDLRVRALSIGGEGLVLGQQGDLDGARRCFVEAESQAAEIGDRKTAAFYLHNRGVAHEARAELDLALACYREAEDLSRRLGDRLRVAVSLGSRANAHAQLGDSDRALACYAEAEAIARDLGARQRIAQIVGNRGALHAMRGEFSVAVSCYREAETIARELGDLRRVAVTLAQRARALVESREGEEALACIDEAVAIADRMGDRLLVARNLCDRATVLDALGRPEDALASVREGLRAFEGMHADHSVVYLTSKAHLARLLVVRGEGEQGRQVAGEVVALAATMGVGEEFPEAAVRDALAGCRALLKRDMGRDGAPEIDQAT